ncbi:hypothetical protein ACE1OC_26345 [Streptomyces sp. DSM 116496]|uniref:hypothetical protein n=1 Tax=Streptomyces stoeckheimensis TaxID=3344656 RepID=UPI0038B2D6BA
MNAISTAAKRSVLALVCLVAAAGCSTEQAGPRAADPCAIADPSAERDLIKQITGSGDFDTRVNATTAHLVDSLKGDLRSLPSTPWLMCGYVPTQGKDASRVQLQVRWLYRESKEQNPQGTVPVEANGAVGWAGDTGSQLRVRCDMPGDLRGQSDNALLAVEESFRIGAPRPNMTQADRDRQTSLTYLMARRVAEALGCENKPLKRAPVVKVLPSPTPTPTPTPTPKS